MRKLRRWRWSSSQLAQARKMWEANTPSAEVMQYLGLTSRVELYNVRSWQGWPSRYRGRALGRSTIRFTYTREEALIAERMWRVGSGVLALMKTLHLANRDQLYKVRDLEGWGPRELFPSRLPALRGELIEAAPPPEKKRTYKRFNPNVKRPRPTEHLLHVCPNCHFRVAPDPEHSLWIDGQLFHRGCAPSQAA